MSFKEYLELFLVFLKIGSFTFGGGFAMIPLIEKELVTDKKWLKKDEIINLFAVSQSIPGAIAINTATLVGYKVGGKRGALVSTLGVVLPSFFIILLIAAFFEKISDYKITEAIFTGINGAVIIMILIAAIGMLKASIKGKLTLGIGTLTVIGISFLNISPIYIIVLGIVIGIIKYIAAAKKGEDSK
ncbi:MAG: chromate transporter [Epulopiscium sp.]|nr:chromate transporter [Candidatus Epulonipiscium sp.]